MFFAAIYGILPMFSLNIAILRFFDYFLAIQTTHRIFIDFNRYSTTYALFEERRAERYDSKNTRFINSEIRRGAELGIAQKAKIKREANSLFPCSIICLPPPAPPLFSPALQLFRTLYSFYLLISFF